MLPIWLLIMMFTFTNEFDRQPKCLVGQGGYSYCLTNEDREWFTKALYCEAGSVTGREEMEAVGWTLIHRFYQTRHVFPSLSRFLQEYCQCINPEWSSIGHKRTSRNIVARVDRMRAMPVSEIPWRIRQVAVELLAGEIADRWPTYVHFLATGHESQASPDLVGPYYVTEGSVGRNAFYANSRSVKWLPAPVNFVERSNVCEP